MNLRSARAVGSSCALSPRIRLASLRVSSRAALGLAIVWAPLVGLGCGSGDDVQSVLPQPDAGASGDAGALVAVPDAALADALPAGDGSAPRGMAIPSPNGLQAIWGSSDSDVWAAGDMGTIVHFDGSVWSLVPSGVTENLTCLTGTGANDVWATGDGGSVLHWDGTAWRVASNVPETALLGVWAASPDDVWTVGIDFNGDGLGGSGYVRHWTGTSWDDADVLGTDTLWKVWGSGSTDVWLVGTSQGQGLIYRGDGNFNDVAFTGESVHGIWGTGPNDVWVAPASGALQHWTGTAFAEAPPAAATQGVHGLGGTATDDIWAVGDNGIIEHYAGDAWTLEPSGTSETLFSVWTPSPGDAWLVGSHATVLRWDGAAWK
jgi:hypothetical protein